MQVHGRTIPALATFKNYKNAGMIASVPPISAYGIIYIRVRFILVNDWEALYSREAYTRDFTLRKQECDSFSCVKVKISTLRNWSATTHNIQGDPKLGYVFNCLL